MSGSNSNNYLSVSGFWLLGGSTGLSIGAMLASLMWKLHYDGTAAGVTFTSNAFALRIIAGICLILGIILLALDLRNKDKRMPIYVAVCATLLIIVITILVTI